MSIGLDGLVTQWRLSTSRTRLVASSTWQNRDIFKQKQQAEALKITIKKLDILNPKCNKGGGRRFRNYSEKYLGLFLE